MRLVGAILLVFAFTTFARAQGDDSAARQAARAHYAKGTSYFDLGRYDEAVAEYELAYQARNEPSLLYNMAQAHRLANHAALALRFYKMYLTKVPDAGNRDEVEAKIATLQRIVEEQNKAQRTNAEHGASTPPATMSKPPAEIAPMASSPPAATAVREPVTTPDRGGRGKRIAGGVVAGAGLAIIAGGIVCGVLAKNASDAISTADRMHQPYDAATYQSGKTDQILEGVLLGAGGAALVTGVVLFAVGHRETKHASVATTVQPALSPTSVALELRGSF